MPKGRILGPKLCSCKEAWALFWALIGPLLGFDLVKSSSWRSWVKTHGTHNVPFFPSGGVRSSPVGKILFLFCFVFVFVFFFLAIVGNDGPLMLACSNAHVSGEYTISGVALSTTFRISTWFVTSIKWCKVSGFYLTG